MAEYETLRKQFEAMMESCKKKMEEASVKFEDEKSTTPAATTSKPKEGSMVSACRCKNCSSERF